MIFSVTAGPMDNELPPKSRLERLPAELQLQINGDLDYGSVIMLSQANQFLHSFVDPQDVVEATKIDFVRKAQYWKEHHNDSSFNGGRKQVFRTITAGYACFTCLKVKPMHAFSSRQIVKCNKRGQRNFAMRNDTRCCIDCQIAKKALRHGVKVSLLYKIATLCDSGFRGYGYLRVFNIRRMEVDSMKYCAECNVLHTDKEWEESRCKNVELSQKATKKHHKTYKSKHDSCRQTKRSVLRRQKLPDWPDLRCGVCEPESETVRQVGKEYCPECHHWICWACLRSTSSGLYAACGGEQDHRLKTATSS